MAVRRTQRFNPDVNQGLLDLVEGFQYAPYNVQANSGYRPGDPRQHGRGNAIDIALLDPKTQAELQNYQSPETAQAYQQYAHALYQYAKQTNPELAEKLRWGGYFSGSAGKYGALDLMHFDIAGGEGGLGMGGGSWAGGWTPEMQDTWNIKNIQELGVDGALAAGYSPEQVQKAFLQTIRGPESGGAYNVLYGGEKFDDMSKHPGRRMPIMKDGQVEGYSTASGAYGFTQDTWNDLVKKYGYKDFSQASQDQAAWQLAQDRFKAASNGGDLQEALASGDPGRINAAAALLKDTWASLPGGKQPGKAYAGKTYADVFNQALGPSGQGGGKTWQGEGGTQGTGGSDLELPDAEKKPDEHWLQTLGKGIGNIKFAQNKVPAIQPMPEAARMDAPAGGPMVAQRDPNRMQLAQLMMQRLNSGRLF